MKKRNLVNLSFDIGYYLSTWTVLSWKDFYNMY